MNHSIQALGVCIFVTGVVFELLLFVFRSSGAFYYVCIAVGFIAIIVGLVTYILLYGDSYANSRTGRKMR